MKNATTRRILTLHVERQLVGILVDEVREVLTARDITPIPLTDRHIAGLCNVHGRIFTVIDLRPGLGLAERTEHAGSQILVLDHPDSLALIVDSVGDVVTGELGTPSGLSADFHHCDAVNLMKGALSVQDELIPILDIDRLLETEPLEC